MEINILLLSEPDDDFFHLFGSTNSGLNTNSRLNCLKLPLSCFMYLIFPASLCINKTK